MNKKENYNFWFTGQGTTSSFICKGASSGVPFRGGDMIVDTS